MTPITVNDIRKIAPADDTPTITITASPYNSYFSGVIDGGGGSGGGGGGTDASYIIGKIGLQKYNFLVNMNDIALKIASDLNIPQDYILGLVAYESGWLGDHAQQLHNDFGLTNAGGNNLSFSSYADSGDAFEQSQAWRFTDAPVTSVDQFINDLNKTPAFNSVNPNWSATLKSVISSVDKALAVYEEGNPKLVIQLTPHDQVNVVGVHHQASS